MRVPPVRKQFHTIPRVGFGFRKEIGGTSVAVVSALTMIDKVPGTRSVLSPGDARFNLRDKFLLQFFTPPLLGDGISAAGLLLHLVNSSFFYGVPHLVGVQCVWGVTL